MDFIIANVTQEPERFNAKKDENVGRHNISTVMSVHTFSFAELNVFRMPRRGAVYEACYDATSSSTESGIAEALRHQTAAAIHAQSDGVNWPPLFGKEVPCTNLVNNWLTI